VRVRTAQNYYLTDDQGSFLIENIDSHEPITLTAWAPGYFIAAVEDVDPQETSVEIILTRIDDQDHPDYVWVSPFASAGADANCENCHSDDSGLLPFEEWLADSHSQTLSNPRFLNLYKGTDLAGNTSPPTRYAFNRDYGSFPLPPNPKEPYFGPGYKLDFPNTAGNCAACHAPAAAINDPYGINPTLLDKPDSSGITCDFCHKIWDARLEADTGMPFHNSPGVLSFEYRRPGEGHQFFAGPFDDVAPGEDTYTPIQTESAYCAPCHFGVFWDTVIYNSYGEWLNSPYNDPEQGQTCQDCHMPALGATYFAIPDAGGLERDPERIRSHKMLGVQDEQFMQQAASLAASTTWQDGNIRLEVEITNDNTGHKLPSDSPLRNVILLVQASDETGEPLELLEGPRLPDLAGTLPEKPGHYANEPGKIFALVLQERWTGVTPTAAYWNPVRIIEDSRLAPFESDRSVFLFACSSGGPATISVQLIFRRAFAELAEQKGWGIDDLLLHDLKLELEAP
jgi:nitrate/TMAO reductase-like tetraheme cytochrome c subunit